MANTTSGTYTFDKTFAIDDTIAEAYERIGLVGSSGHQLLSARRSLNLLFQEWGNRGVHFWEIGHANVNLITPVAGTGAGRIYKFFRSSGDGTNAACTDNDGSTTTTLFYGVTDIINCAYRKDLANTSSQADTGMTKVSRDTYAAFANKLSTGTPSQWWVQRFIDRVELTIYPTPSATAVSEGHLSIYYVQRIQDIDSTYTDATDLPYRFLPAMVSGLSFILSQKFAPQRTQELKLLYEDDFARALAEDGSAASTYITPKTYYPNI